MSRSTHGPLSDPPHEQGDLRCEGWRPSHQYLPAPGAGKGLPVGALVVVGLLALYAIGSLVSGVSAFGWLVELVLPWALGLGVLVAVVRAWHEGWLPRRLGASEGGAPGVEGRQTPVRAGADPRAQADTRVQAERDRVGLLAARVCARCERMGGGAYLGLGEDGGWVCADPEHAVMVLGPPRSGKTSAIVIPSILAAPGPVISTATKRDVMAATVRSRAQAGEVWLYDPAGDCLQWPAGVRRLCWSPVPAAATWDGALLVARAMAATGQPGKGTSNEGHWRERSTALLAPLLHAAHVTDRPVERMLAWVLRGELEDPRQALEDHGAQTAADVLAGIIKTDERERSSILSATAGVLAAYNADAARRNCAHPNFDPDTFVLSTDTVYIAAPAHKQALCAPLVVGLLEEIRHAAYKHAPVLIEQGRPPVYMALDEAANIAPIHDLPALASEAGGQRLHVLIGLQDLSQARKRWGESAADGFLSLFQTKVILDGIADPKTLEAVSLCLGEYDRQLASQTLGRSQTQIRLKKTNPTHSEGVSYSTQRQRILTPGKIAALPSGRALHLHGTRWQLIRTTRWYQTQPWRSLSEAM
jgi:type IV secretion system protein VirD4